MPDHPVSVHPPPFDYDDSIYRSAAEAAKDQTHGHCRKCGRKLPLEAHHWTKGPYPPAHLTTANDLTAFCRDCHNEAHDFRFFLDVGGAPEDYRKACSETVATLLLRPEAVRRSLMRVGRAVWCEGRWAALVTGGARPRCGEVFCLFMRSRREWRDVVVTDVLDGRPGFWRVRKRFLGTGENWSCPSSVDTYPLGEEEESTMPKSRPPYPAAFRQQMVELVRSGRTPGELAREFEPSAEAIRNWAAQADRDAGKRSDGLRTEEHEEIRRLRRENRQLREEREILAKATAWFARETGPGRSTGS